MNVHFRKGGRGARLVVCLAASLAAVGALTLPVTALAHGHAHKAQSLGVCDSHRTAAVKQTARALVWKKATGSDPFGERVTTLYACLLPKGKSVVVGLDTGQGDQSDSGVNPGNAETSQLHVTQTIVSDVFSSGYDSVGSCSKYDGSPNCEAASVVSMAQVFNLATRKSLYQTVASGSIAISLTVQGAIAWEAPTNAFVAGSPLELQAVRFDPSSLKKSVVNTLAIGALGQTIRFAGLVINWTDSGQPASMVVPNTTTAPPPTPTTTTPSTT